MTIRQKSGRNLQARKARIRARQAERSRLALDFERLENRAMMSSIVWANRNSFTGLGEKTADARAIIDQAITDWTRVIQNFNYRNVGQNGWAPTDNTYTININVQDWQSNPNEPNTLARCGPTAIDGDGRPYAGSMGIDDNAANGMWYFDPSPGDDFEFTTGLAPFAGGSGPAGTDLYSVVLHELGHGLGFLTGGNLALSRRIHNHIFTFNDGSLAHFTADDNHSSDAIHTNDLMNPTVSSNMRQTISDLDARILGDAYGYDIDLPYVYQRSFATTYNARSRQLTIWGDLGTMSNPLLERDKIYLNVMADNIYVNVNAYEKWISTNSVSSLVILGRNANDEIKVVATRAGKPLNINAGAGDKNTVILTDQFKNLSYIQGDITILEEGGRTYVNFHDENKTAPRNFTIVDNSVRFTGSPATVRYSGYASLDQNTYSLIFRGGSGGNTFTVQNEFASRTNTRILAGTGNDIVNVLGVSVQGLIIDGVNGVDRVTVGSVSRAGLLDIFGSVRVSNSNGLTNLIYDDSNDPSKSRTLRMEADRVRGLCPSIMYFDPAGIQSITVRASNDSAGVGNLITVADTPQNRAGNLWVSLETGRNADNVFVEATHSELTVQGQNGLDRVNIGKDSSLQFILAPIFVKNMTSHSHLTLDDANDTTVRQLLVSDSSVSLSTANVYFSENDLRSLAVFCGPGSVLGTVYDTPQNGLLNGSTYLDFSHTGDFLTIRKTTGPLKLDGGGGLDVVNIGYNGKLNQINGVIDISNEPVGGYTELNIDGSRDTVAQTVAVDALSVTGIAPADIRFKQADLSSLKVSGNSKGNTFNVLNTPQNGAGTVNVTLNTGTGSDVVNVQRIRSTTTINGQSGADIVNVGQNGNVRYIDSTLFVTNTSSFSTINLDNSADLRSKNVTMNVVNILAGQLGTVDGLAPGQIVYKRADLRALNIWGGWAADIFTVANTIESGVLGGSTTTIHPGSGGDRIHVLGTTGALILDLQHDENRVVIGSDGLAAGTLNSIRGAISIRGDSELTNNFLQIDDSGSASRYVYVLDSMSFYRTNLQGNAATATIDYNQMPIDGFTMVGANQGNRFEILGTPGANTVDILTGGRNDTVNLFGARYGQLNLALGDGLYQSVTIGDAAHSLDEIQGNVFVSGSGFIDVSISDAASTEAHRGRFDEFNGVVLVERILPDANGNIVLNRFELAFGNSSRLFYQAGRVSDDGYNQVDVVAVPGHFELFVTGGPDLDIFTIGDANGMGSIHGRVNFNSPDGDDDYAYFYDYFNPNSGDYILFTDPGDPNSLIVLDESLNTIKFNGLTQLIYYTPLVGGNTLDIRSLPELYFNCIVGPNDEVSLGSSGPALGGTMNSVSGFLQFQGYYPDETVVFTLDDSGNNNTARNVEIAPYNLPGEWGFISGLGPSSLLFADHPNWYFDIRGGGLNDSFVMSGDPLAARMFLSGGGGNDVLIGSGGNWLYGGAGRDLLVAGSLPSQLDGGIDEDILMGGSLHDISQPYLNAIRDEWIRTGPGDDYQSRVHRLRADLLSDDKLTGNDGENSLGGSAALDLFFGSHVLDLEAFEVVVPLTP